MSKLELRKYQRTGVDFLKNRGAVLLADAPGIGKTPQTIVAIKELDEYRILVLCPNSMVFVWAEEISKWDEDAIAVPVIGSYAEKRSTLINEYDPTNKTRKYFITNWETLAQTKRLPFENCVWDVVVADEVHKIKNRKAKTTRALKQITNTKKRKVRKIGLSGTPFINSADELWSILNWFDPKRWSSYWKFVETYMVMENRPWGKQIVGQKYGGKLLEADIRPWMLRRLKSDVLKELPDKQYQHIWTEISKLQYDLYMSMKRDFFIEYGDVEIDASGLLDQLIRFQQLIVSPAVLDPSLPDESPRLDAVEEYVVNYGKPVVVFSRFVATIHLLEQRFQKVGIPTWSIYGDVSSQDRADRVHAFQAHNGPGVMLCTIAAGGVGITLHNASTILFVDRDWSPAINGQAEDRVHRFGQKNAVNVVTFGIPGTVDTRVIQVLNTKAKEFKKIFISDAIGTPPKPGKMRIHMKEET